MQDDRSSRAISPQSVLIASAILLAVGVLLVVAIRDVNPQLEFAFRVLMAIGAAGMVAALIPGLIDGEGDIGALSIKASGPIVVFLLVMFINPQPLGLGSPTPVPTFAVATREPALGVASPVASPGAATPIGAATPAGLATPIGPVSLATPVSTESP